MIMNMAVRVNAITVNMVEPNQLALVWGQVEKWLDHGEKFFRGYYKPDHIFNAISQGMMQLWIGHTNAKIRIIMLTQLDFYPEGTQLRFVYMGGEPRTFALIEHLFGKVEQWGVQHGAIAACVIGREAWIKKLAKYGYQKKSVLLVKPLVNTFGQTWSH